MQLRRHLLILRACTLLAALVVTGCATRQPVTGPPRTAAFNATDTAWIQLMIPMTERAHLLTTLAPTRTTDPTVANLASRTGTRLEHEQALLRALLELSGIPDTHPHEGHDMPGMVSLGTLTKARAATGREFDRLLTDGLRAHFAQSGTLCASEQASGSADEAKALAATVAGSAAERLAELSALTELARLGPSHGPQLLPQPLPPTPSATASAAATEAPRYPAARP
ncbi:DUF305 domain-containing protein [Streptomyces sp. NPDC093089]|uniref:DUF305 domain-containing protein n=1 Tax=Streptomyces sp. NPDC093089 TaxID=3366024 RepID=UPI00382902AC